MYVYLFLGNMQKAIQIIGHIKIVPVIQCIQVLTQAHFNQSKRWKLDWLILKLNSDYNYR